MEIPADMQATLIVIVNAAASMIVFKLKQYKDRASAANRRADAITAIVDEALRDGEITTAELKRIVRAARRVGGAE